MKPLNLLILMAEVFFSLSVCFFFFLFSWMLWAGLGPRLPGRLSDRAIYLSTSVASAPPPFLHHSPPACLHLPRFFTALCLCVPVPVPVSNHHTSRAIPLLLDEKKKLKKKNKKKKNSGRLKKREKVFPKIADHSHPCPPTCLHSLFLFTLRSRYTILAECR